ncbi:MAG: hypothetical protein EXS31_09890 [Pedosphaera sp.]|nr:hypothetical protein [Pedosphaera sp.]
MISTLPAATDDGIIDPRESAGFASEYFPTTNGKESPVASSSDRNSRIMGEFAAAYYDINRQYAKLLQIRAEPPRTGMADREREQMQNLERALRSRDELEDRCAPLGVIVEPVMRAGFAIDLKCGFGNVDALGRTRSELVIITGSVPIPLPPGARLENYLVSIEGPSIPFYAATDSAPLKCEN